MVSRILLKLFFATVCFVVLVVTSLSAAAYLAFSTPSFYAELLDQPIEPAGAVAIEERLEAMRMEFVRWRQQSLAFQIEQRKLAEVDRAEANREGDVPQPAPKYDPDKDLFTIRITEDEINAVLAAEADNRGKEDLSNPRIRIEEDQVQVAFTVASPVGELVLSAAFAPEQPEAGDLKLQITSASVGRLPLPLSTVVQYLPKKEAALKGDLMLDTTGKLPSLVLRSDGRDNEVAAPKSIRCVAGEIVVELMAPKLRTN